MVIYYPNFCGTEILINAHASGGFPDYQFTVYFGDYSSQKFYETTKISVTHEYASFLQYGYVIPLTIIATDNKGNQAFEQSCIRLNPCDDPDPPEHPDDDNTTNPPELIWEPASIDFGYMLEGNIGYKTLSVSNNGTGNIDYNFMWDSNWFNITPWNGSVSTNLIENIHVVTINTTGLSLGEHNGYIYINSKPIAVSVNIVDELPLPSLNISSNSCDLGVVYRGQLAACSFDLWNNGDGKLEYRFNSTNSSINIYERNIRAGTSQGEHHTIFIEIDTSILNPGSYTFEINIDSNGGNSSFFVNFEVYVEKDFLNIIKPASGYLYLFGIKLFRLPFLYNMSLIFGPILIKVDDSDFSFKYIEFWLDDELVNTSYTDSDNYRLAQKMFGLHRILVKGYDENGFLVDTCEEEFLIYNFS